MNPKKTILLITTTHLAKNPRLVKEMEALQLHYQVAVVFFSLLTHYKAFDDQIIEAYPGINFYKINWVKKYYPCRFFYTFLQKILLLIWKVTGKLVWAEQLFFPGFAYLKRKCRGIKADLIHAHNPGSWAVAVQLGREKRIPSSFDIEDFHSGEYELNDPKKKILEAIEDKYLSQTDFLSAASPLIANAYLKKYPFKKITVVNNVFPAAQFQNRKTFNLQDPLQLVWFSQMIGPDRGLREVIDGVNQLKFKVVLNLYGDCDESYRAEILQHIHQPHEVRFKGLLSNDALNKALSQYDVGVASEMGHTPNRDFCLTNKIFAYVQAGLSVLASDTAAQAQFLSRYPRVGNLYHRQSPSAISSILTTLNTDRLVLQQQQRDAYHLGQTELCWEQEAIVLSAHFDKAIHFPIKSFLNIAITVDPEIPVPPTFYGGIERIVYLLVEELIKRGHKVTLFANPASKTSAKLVPWLGKRSPSFYDTLQNSYRLWSHYQTASFDVVHSFSRLAYLTPILNQSVAKVMSYQREPTLSQVKKARLLSYTNSLHFTGCSHYIANQLKGVAKVSAIYNGVDLSQYKFESVVADDAPLVFLGRIEKIKGTHLAIELAKRSGRNLIIAGNIPEGGQLYFKEEVLPFLNEKIQYIGPVTDEEKNGLLGKAAALLMPILWDEPFGIVMIEAMACGTPVIGFARGAIKEVVVNGKNGYLGEDIKALESAIQKISSIHRAYVRNYVATNFSASVIVNQYLALYRKTILECKKG